MNRVFMIVLPMTCCIAPGCSLINRDAETPNAIEAHLRYHFDHNSTFENYQPVFLTIQGNDPSPDFLKRFDGSKIEVKKGSEAQEKGVRYRIDSCEWVSHDRIEIAFSYQCGKKCSGEGLYGLAHHDGKWTVEEEIKEEVE